MTSRERVLKVFNFEKPDRVPVYDLLRNNAAIEYYSGIRISYTDKDREAVLKAISNALDMTRSIRFPKREYLFEEDGFVKRQKEWTSWIEKRPFEGVEGAKEWIKKEVERLQEPRCYPDQWMEDRIEEYRSLQSGLGDTLLLWTATEVGFTDTYTKLGMEYLVYVYAEEPNLVSDLLELKCEESVKRIQSALTPELAPVAFLGEDIAFKGTTMFSPEFLRTEFFPRLKKLVDAYHDKGMKVVFHSDGNLMQVIDDLVGCGIDALNPIEPLAGMDLGELKRTIGHKVVLIGNIDCSQLLPFGSPEDVEHAVRDAIQAAAPGSGYILASSSELHNDIPLENIKAMIEAVRKYGVYNSG